jgi:hypothetical protein
MKRYPPVKIGERFDRLVVLSEAEPEINLSRDIIRRLKRWLCQCDCGNTTTVRDSGLKSGQVKSCSCLQRETARKLFFVHGESGTGKETPEYRAWRHMIERCQNSNHKHYRHYGGRGIIVCKEWLESYEQFLKDVGRKPSSELTLERINNERGYEPGNVKWATRKEQQNNRRACRNYQTKVA